MWVWSKSSPSHWHGAGVILTHPAWRRHHLRHPAWRRHHLTHPVWRRHHGSRRALRRRWILFVCVILVVLALPVPWLHVHSGIVPGTAWRMDGRLEIEGRVIDPPGRWSWLTVGRPKLVGEVLFDAITGTGVPPRDLRHGLRTRSPALLEPSAAAIGLRAAGYDVPLGLIVEVRDPIDPRYPPMARIVSIDGLDLVDRDAWEEARLAWQRRVEGEFDEEDEDDPRKIAFSLPDGQRFTAPGPGLPYHVINILDTAPAGLEAGISFGFTRYLPVDWFRNLSLGSSHGLMVALVTYSDASRRDLAQGRHIAGTGGIRGDGIVTRIGGLPEKARAAQRAGADVLIFPASQAEELEGEDLDGLTLMPVRTLSEAIDRLSEPLLHS
jgi:hypothetical protein